MEILILRFFFFFFHFECKTDNRSSHFVRELLQQLPALLHYLSSQLRKSFCGSLHFIFFSPFCWCPVMEGQKWERERESARYVTEIMVRGNVPQRNPKNCTLKNSFLWCVFLVSTWICVVPLLCKRAMCPREINPSSSPPHRSSMCLFLSLSNVLLLLQQQLC